MKKYYWVCSWPSHGIIDWSSVKPSFKASIEHFIGTRINRKKEWKKFVAIGWKCFKIKIIK